MDEKTTTGQATSHYQLFSATTNEADETLPYTDAQQQAEHAASQYQEEDLFAARVATEPGAQERYHRISLTALWENVDRRAYYETINESGARSISALTRPPAGLTGVEGVSRIRLTEEGIQSFISSHQDLAPERIPQEILHQIRSRNMTRYALANSARFTNSILKELKETREAVQARDRTISQLQRQLPEPHQTRGRTRAQAEVRARSRSLPGAYESESELLASEGEVSEPSPPRQRVGTRQPRQSTREALSAATPFQHKRSTTPPRSGQRSARFPDPKMFSGSREKGAVDFRSWNEDLSSKLRVNADHFDTEDARTAYVMTRLEGDARQHASALASAHGGVEKLCVEMLLDRLREVFDNPNRAKDAKDQLKRLRMGYLQDASEFIGQFSHLATESRTPIATWKEEIHERLYDALQLHMHDAVEDEMVSYHGYTAKLISYSRAVVKAAHSQKARAERSERPTRFSAIPKPSTHAERLARPAPPAQELPTSPARSREKTPAAATPGPRCYNCGDPSHLAPQCPKPKKAPAKEVEPQEASSSELEPEAESESEESSPDPDPENGRPSTKSLCWAEMGA